MASLDLVQRLPSSPADALASLLTLVNDSPDQKTALLEANVLPSLIQLLTHDDDRVQEDAVQLLSQLVQGSDFAQVTASDSGVIEPIVALLTAASSGRTKRLAMLTLRRVVDGRSECQLAAIKARVIPALVGLMQELESDSAVAADAALTLALVVDKCERGQNVAIHNDACVALSLLLQLGVGDARVNAAKAVRCLVSENAAAQQAAIEANTVRCLTELLSSGDVAEKAEASHALACLTKDNELAQKLATRFGAARRLVGFFRSASQSDRNLNVAAVDLGNLVMNNRNRDNAPVDAASIGGFVDFLRSEVQTETSKTSLALANLVENNPDAQKEAIEAGAIPRLLSRLQTGSGKEVANDLLALSNLVEDNKNARATVVESGILSRLFEIFREGTSDEKCSALRLMSCMAEDVGSEIVDSGILKSLGALFDSPETREAALNSLFRFAVVYPVSTIAGQEAGVVDALIRVLSEGPSEVWVLGVLFLVQVLRVSPQDSLIESLCELMTVQPEIRPGFVEAGAVAALLSLLENEDDSLLQRVAQALTLLVEDNEDAQTQAVETNIIFFLGKIAIPGVLSLLVALVGGEGLLEFELIPSLLEQVKDGPENVRLETLEALRCATTHNKDARNEVLRAGGMDILLQVLQAVSRDEKEAAVTILARLLKDNAAEYAKQAVTDGGVRALSNLIDGQSSDAMVKAAETLHYLSIAEPLVNSQLLVTKIVDRVVGYLGDENIGDKVKVLETLRWLVVENQAQWMEAIAAGALEMMLHLIEADDDEVKLMVLTVLQDQVTLCDAATTKVLTEHVFGRLVSLMRGFTGDLLRYTLFVLAEIVDRSTPHVISVDTVLELVDAALDVISRLKDDDVQLGFLAATLVTLLVVNNRTAQTSVLQTGVLARIVELIRDGSMTGQLGSAMAASGLVKDQPAAQKQLVDGGVIPALIDCIRNYNGYEVIAAADALGSIAAYNYEHQVLVVQSGAVELLVKLMMSENKDIVASGVRTVSFLVHKNAIATAAVKEAGAMELVVEQFRSTIRQHKAHAAAALLYLYRAHADFRSTMLEEEVLPFLVQALRVKDDDTKADLVQAIGDFVENDRANQDAVVRAGIIELLVATIGSAHPDTRSKAIVTLKLLLQDNAAAQTAAVAAGALENLVSTFLLQ